MKWYIFFPVMTILFMSAISCGDKDEPKPIDPNDFNSVNGWIYGIMEEHYLWYQELPPKNSLDLEADPENFFQRLLSDKDGTTLTDGRHVVFSTIEKKEADTKAIEENKPTYGFEYVLVRAENNAYGAKILYVLPGSPAYKAGMKRGDVILSTGENRKPVTDPDIFDSGGAVLFNVATINSQGNLVDRETLSLEAAGIVVNTPFIKDTVINYGGYRVGYLAYTHFDSGPSGTANDKTYDNEMKEIFARFKAQNVDEFVLDLRYNGGGLVSSARLMTSLLAPSQALNEGVFCIMTYNGKKEKGNEEEYKFDNSAPVKASNLNLNKLYVLTGMQTASSSEAVINTLIPYIGRENIVIMGDRTIGKTVGSNTYGNNDKEGNYGYILHPITFHIYNADGNADYNGGFVPDVYYNEYESLNLQFGELGSPAEPLFQKALVHIAGKSSLRSGGEIASGTEYKPVSTSLSRRYPQEMIFDLD